MNQEADLAIAVAPIWKTEPWFVKLLEMAIDTRKIFQQQTSIKHKEKARSTLKINSCGGAMLQNSGTQEAISESAGRTL